MNKIVALNVQSIRALNRRLLLETFLKNNCHNAGIVFLSETNLKASVNFNLKNWNIFRNDRESDGGGVAILLRDNIKFRNTKTFNFPIESIQMEIFINSEWILIGSVYIPPNLKKNDKHYQMTERDLGKIFNHPTKAIFGGDFNARSTNWGDSSDNVNGKIIWEFLKNSEFNIHASTSPTCFRCIDGSFIDFFISKEIDSRQKCFAFPSFSDHYAIFLNYACESTQNSSPLRLVKQYNLVNVKKINEFIYNKLIDMNIPQHCNLSNDNIDEIADKIDLMFREAIEKFVPKTQIPIGNIILSNQTKALNKKFRTISRMKFRNRFNPDSSIRINFNLIKNMYINSIKRSEDLQNITKKIMVSQSCIWIRKKQCLLIRLIKSAKNLQTCLRKITC